VSPRSVGLIRNRAEFARKLEQAARNGALFDANLADTEDRRDAFGVAAYSLWGSASAAFRA
jgi:hypothetical protein